MSTSGNAIAARKQAHGQRSIRYLAPKSLRSLIRYKASSRVAAIACGRSSRSRKISARFFRLPHASSPGMNGRIRTDASLRRFTNCDWHLRKCSTRTEASTSAFTQAAAAQRGQTLRRFPRGQRFEAGMYDRGLFFHSRQTCRPGCQDVVENQSIQQRNTHRGGVRETGSQGRRRAVPPRSKGTFFAPPTRQRETGPDIRAPKTVTSPTRLRTSRCPQMCVFRRSSRAAVRRDGDQGKREDGHDCRSVIPRVGDHPGLFRTVAEVA